jgi:hypothetical protein
MTLLSLGLRPSSAGGRVKPILVLGLMTEGSLLNVTRDRPFSIVKVERWENLVRGGSGLRRKENIVQLRGCE